jgi:hypothetical protein
LKAVVNAIRIEESTMAKMFSLMNIHRPVTDEMIPPRTVFDAEPAEANQLEDMNAERKATAQEVEAAKKAQDKLDGVLDTTVRPTNDAPKPQSNAPGDPQNLPQSLSQEDAEV